jgi:tRNA dimethylallyltransferase
MTESNSEPDHPPLLSIVGPTGVGKSGFALEVARRFRAEIISCDSMAVYRGLDIGTDKPRLEDRETVRHHLIDVAEPGTYFSAGAFRSAAREAMAAIATRGALCLLVGGTGLYYRALMEGLVEIPGRQEGIRQRLKERCAARSPEALHRLLGRLDPATAARVGPRDVLRIVRALEVRLATGKPLSQWIASRPFGSADEAASLRVGLTASRATLYRRIDRRVDAMMAEGLLEEVRALLSLGVLHGPARKAIGYGELADHLEGFSNLDDAVNRIKLRSRHLAKRQLAWFKNERSITWYDIDKEAWRNDAIQFIQRWLSKTCAQPRDQHPEPDPELREEGSRPDHDLPC